LCACELPGRATFVTAVAVGFVADQRDHRPVFELLRIGRQGGRFGDRRFDLACSPVDRKGSGVSRYRVRRPVDDPNYVLIDLEFDTQAEAEALLAAMRHVWGRVQGTVVLDPQARIVETVETREY
jgi:hypothetical protein